MIRAFSGIWLKIAAVMTFVGGLLIFFRKEKKEANDNGRISNKSV